MTPATTKTRTRKPRPAKAVATRDPWIDGLTADFLILSSRLAELPEPVFWAEGELDARTALAVQTAESYDDNYRRVFDNLWWDWNWYRDAKLMDERAALPAFTFDDDPELTARVNRLMSAVPLDDPGPVPAPSPPGLAADSPVPLPSQGAGPGSSTSDEASDDQS